MLLDTCGTGGDKSGTFNISTTVAFVAAGAGLKVAKHGNRAASSKCGSADVLAQLGVNLDLTPEQVGKCVDDVGIGFLFAAKLHPAMKNAIGPRREIAVRTIFNILGPLTNPAGARRQLMGVFTADLTPMLAHVLGDLGSLSALVVSGYGNLDELTTTGPNHRQPAEGRRGHDLRVRPRRLRLPGRAHLRTARRRRADQRGDPARHPRRRNQRCQARRGAAQRGGGVDGGRPDRQPVAGNRAGGGGHRQRQGARQSSTR